MQCGSKNCDRRLCLPNPPLGTRFCNRPCENICSIITSPLVRFSAIMVQMNHKLAIAKILLPMKGWEDRLFRSKFRLAHRIARSPEGWPAKSVSWNPLTNWESNFASKPHRKRGRPSTRWDDILTNFSSEFFHNENWWHVAREASSWFTSERSYVQFCRAHFGL